MSYLCKGCYDFESVTYVAREGLGTWSITLRDEEELLAVSLKEDNGKELYFTNIAADKIYNITNQGNKGLDLTFTLGDVGTVPVLIINHVPGENLQSRINECSEFHITKSTNQPLFSTRSGT